jgi:hypothetical protein
MNVDYLWKINRKTAAVGSMIRSLERLALLYTIATSQQKKRLCGWFWVIRL